MKHLGNILFLIACFGVGVGIAKFIMYLRRPVVPPTVVTGVGRLMPYRGFGLDAHHPPTATGLQALLDHHATILPIHYPSSQSAEADLTSTVQFVRSNAATRGLPLLLLPPDPPLSGIMNPYPLPLPEIARQAQRLGFQFIVVSHLTVTPDEDYWTTQLAAARKNFTGRFILGGSYYALTRVDFWASVDNVGLLASSLPLSDKADPSMHDLRVGWSSYLDTVESISRGHGKPLFLLDYAYESSKKNAEAARRNYEALLLESKGRLNIDGILFREWSFAPAPSGEAINAHPEILSIVGSTWASESVPPSATNPPESTPTLPAIDDTLEDH